MIRVIISSLILSEIHSIGYLVIEDYDERGDYMNQEEKP